MTVRLRVTTSDRYDDVVDRLVAEKVASRLAAQDPSLWGPDAESEASIRLSWVGLPVSSRPLLAEIDALRAELWSEGIDRVVLCGMGGSSLAPELVSRTFDLRLEVLDSTNPHVVERALTGDLQRTVVVVSSKSGTTLETDSQRRAFVRAFDEAGIDAASRLVVVTDPGSELERLAAEHGYRKTFLADPHVGGRYSALTAFGLVPTGLAGVDVADLLDEAEEVMSQLSKDSSDNPALRLGAALAEPGRDKVLLVDDGSGYRGFGDWVEQLIAESTGKQGKGLLPVVVPPPGPTKPTADSHVFRLVGEDAEEPQTADEVRIAGSLGGLLQTWETAVPVAGKLIGINPFDQPDVESAKAAARGLLESTPGEEPAAIEEDGVEVRGSAGLLDGVDTVAGAVERLFDRLDPDRGYVAVMAYLDSQRDGALADVAGAVADRVHRPVTFGWGPRFLHSTGQYHKGGPPVGVFIQVTADEAVDVEIAGRPFTFGQLIAAQAAGDAHVLEEHGRPVLRLHLAGPGRGVAVLRGVLR